MKRFWEKEQWKEGIGIYGNSCKLFCKSGVERVKSCLAKSFNCFVPASLGNFPLFSLVPAASHKFFSFIFVVIQPNLTEEEEESSYIQFRMNYSFSCSKED